MYVYRYIHIYIYAYIYIHMYTHIYIYTHKLPSFSVGDEQLCYWIQQIWRYSKRHVEIWHPRTVMLLWCTVDASCSPPFSAKSQDQRHLERRPGIRNPCVLVGIFGTFGQLLSNNYTDEKKIDATSLRSGSFLFSYVPKTVSFCAFFPTQTCFLLSSECWKKASGEAAGTGEAQAAWGRHIKQDHRDHGMGVIHEKTKKNVATDATGDIHHCIGNMVLSQSLYTYVFYIYIYIHKYKYII